MMVPRWSLAPAFNAVPDIVVYATLGEQDLTSLDVARLGPPDLILEVVSPSTWRRDLDPDDPTCKPTAYAALGVAEYLAFDPTGTFEPAQVSAWHLVGGRRERWLPAVDGRCHSRLGISFAVEGVRLRVHDQDGPTAARVLSSGGHGGEAGHGAPAGRRAA